MAVLSQQVSTALSMPACIRAALIAAEVPPSNGTGNRERPSYERGNGDGNGHHGNGSNGNGSAEAARKGKTASADSQRSSTVELTLKGGLVIGGLGVELIFRGTPQRNQRTLAFPRDLTTKTMLLPAGEVVEVEGESTRIKIEGDPAAWVQVRDGNGVPLSDSVFVGRIGKGACLMDPAFRCQVQAETFVSPVGIADSDLTLTGEMTFDRGLTLRVILRRREGPLWWARRPDAVLDFEIAPVGHMVHFPAQPIWIGESVGQLRSLIFLDGEGEPIGDEHPLRSTVALQ